MSCEGNRESDKHHSGQASERQKHERQVLALTPRGGETQSADLPSEGSMRCTWEVVGSTVLAESELLMV